MKQFAGGQKLSLALMFMLKVIDEVIRRLIMFYKKNHEVEHLTSYPNFNSKNLLIH